ncbi:DUF2905 domain-containing protein [Rosettibacter firmus]|uniref:DUF2905 domain-containing protein n=1 Tax=Rosettibacter firmus TaxID=3111522 RepID=UPI00336C1356
MNEFQTLGKLLIFGGALIILLGLFMILWGKIPFVGRLPGDIIIKGKNFTFYFPIVTSIILSIIISLILYLIKK